jgi:hypothetical protein
MRRQDRDHAQSHDGTGAAHRGSLEHFSKVCSHGCAADPDAADAPGRGAGPPGFRLVTPPARTSDAHVGWRSQRSINQICPVASVAVK